MTKPDKPSPKRSRAIDPQQRAIRWAKKGQTKEARLFGALRRELIAHVGGNPSAAERALIDRCAMLQTHLARMDEKMFLQGEMSDHAGRQYLAWANSVSRMLQALGLKAPAPKELTAADGLRILREQYGVGGSDE
jgi:hypothetical protein